MPKVTEQYSEARRQQIIDAAYRCFARKGFHQTSMRDIYTEAGLSPGAVYHYFNSKDDIIEASFVFDYQRSQPVFEQAEALSNPEAALEQLIGVFYSGVESAADLGADRVNIQGWAEAIYNPRLQTPLREFMRSFRGVVARLIQRGQAAGKIEASLDPEAVGEIVLSSFLGLYLQKSLLPELDIERYQKGMMALLHGVFTQSS